MGQNILILYFRWQFIDATRSILKGWVNCLRFNLNYWSVPLLLRTWVSHWRRYKYSYGRGFSFKRYFEAFTFNMVSRFIGGLMRSILIVFGIFTEVVVFIFGAVVFVIWLILPLLLLGGLFYGFKILF